MTPIHLILPREEVPSLIDPSLYEVFCWSGQAAGWMTSEIFELWVEKVCPLKQPDDFVAGLCASGQCCEREAW